MKPSQANPDGNSPEKQTSKNLPLFLLLSKLKKKLQEKNRENPYVTLKLMGK